MVVGNGPLPLLPPPSCLAAVARANADAYGNERGIHQPSATVTSEQTITTYETTNVTKRDYGDDGLIFFSRSGASELGWRKPYKKFN